MKRDIAERWAAAVESGNYTQGIGQLTRVTPEGEYDCCLAVLCKLAIADGVPIQRYVLADRDRDEEGNDVISYDDNACLLPGKVLRWAGMKTVNGTYDNSETDDHRSLAMDNDNGRPFPEIAEIIRQHANEL
jgi:hypothetical protein